MKFQELNISDGLKRAVAEMGFVCPTPIQEEVIPVMQTGKDVIALAPTGTGKTCAFGIPLVEKIDKEVFSVQAVVMCPTRELAMQTEAELHKLAKYTEGVRILAIYGGQNIERQLYGLRKKPQILVCTPGRLMDHLNRHTVSLAKVTTVVLDEADEMLDMGFREDISAILGKIETEVQVTMFSATMSKEIRALSAGFQNDPVPVNSDFEEEKPKITQYVIRLKEANKIDALETVMMNNALKFVLIFCNTKRKVDAVNKELTSRGYLSAALHGDLLQRQRDKVMKAYRSREINILVATDVAARGIDIKDIEAIFNYDIPNNDEYYVHRIGRTARASKTGTAYSFATSADYHRIRELSKYAESIIEELNLDGITDNRIGGKKNANKTPGVQTTRVFINLGKKDNLNDISLAQFITVTAGLSDDDIQSVSVMDTFSFAEVVPAKLDKVLCLTCSKLGKRKIAIEVAGAARPSEHKQYDKKTFDKRADKKPQSNGEKKPQYSQNRPSSRPNDGKSPRNSSDNAPNHSFADKPRKPNTNRTHSEKPYSKNADGNRAVKVGFSKFDKSASQKPYAKKSDRPYADKPRSDKSYAPKSTKPDAEKLKLDKPYAPKSNKPRFDNPKSAKPYADKPRSNSKPCGRDVGNSVPPRRPKQK